MRALLEPTAAKCHVSVTGFTAAFGANGGTGSATIATSRDCTWTSTVDSPWISLASSEGQGEATLSFGVSANQGA